MVLTNCQPAVTDLATLFSQGTPSFFEGVVFAGTFVRRRPCSLRDRLLRVCPRCGYVDESTIRCRHVIGWLLVDVPGKCRDCAHHPAAGSGTTSGSAGQRTVPAAGRPGIPDSPLPVGSRPGGQLATAGCSSPARGAGRSRYRYRYRAGGARRSSRRSTARDRCLRSLPRRTNSRRLPSFAGRLRTCPDRLAGRLRPACVPRPARVPFPPRLVGRGRHVVRPRRAVQGEMRPSAREIAESCCPLARTVSVSAVV
ncbi:hypothetical protein FsymDg_0232 [Candidatus Protofrankia datiscae]|uniref:Uncharacterized protein n=1 Tax=Candidatus Protofrankia datiscae TaxID=2716812 RepID=F8B2S9_9ACTN|nr:hypothetical protein FsymDg_0232 [Candidatus Protofrankia datiscae]